MLRGHDKWIFNFHGFISHFGNRLTKVLKIKANHSINLTNWTMALAYAVFLINRLPTTFLHNQSPYEVLFDCSPNLTNLKVFGCLAYASTLTANRKKSWILEYASVLSSAFIMEQRGFYYLTYSPSKFSCLDMHSFMKLYFHIRMKLLFLLKQYQFLIVTLHITILIFP